MKSVIGICLLAAGTLFFPRLCAQTQKADSSTRNLYIDVHHLTPGTVTFEDVAKAHAKDLATEGKYHVQFLKYWVDEKEGLVYCLSSATDTQSIRQTHAAAHGLLPAEIYLVTGGVPEALRGNRSLFLDVHDIGPGKVTAAAVAAVHQKDLAVEQKHGVHFINYWVDEKEGKVFCLSEATDSADVVATHKEAHGLLPARVMNVKQGD